MTSVDLTSVEMGAVSAFAKANLPENRCPVISQQTENRAAGVSGTLEKEIATHSSTLAYKIPWTEEPGRLQSMGWQRVRHD